MFQSVRQLTIASNKIPKWYFNSPKKFRKPEIVKYSQDGHYNYAYQTPEPPIVSPPHCGNYSASINSKRKPSSPEKLYQLFGENKEPITDKTVDGKLDNSSPPPSPKHKSKKKKSKEEKSKVYQLIIENKEAITDKNKLLQEEYSSIYRPSIRSFRKVSSSFHNPFLDVSFNKHIGRGLPERGRYTIDKALEIIKLYQLKKAQSDVVDTNTLLSARKFVNVAFRNVKPAVLIQFKEVSMMGLYKPCGVPTTDTRAMYSAMRSVRKASLPWRKKSVAEGPRLAKVLIDSYEGKGKVINDLKENYTMAYKNRHLYSRFGPTSIRKKRNVDTKFPHKLRGNKTLPLAHDEYGRDPGSLSSNDLKDCLDEEDKR